MTFRSLAQTTIAVSSTRSKLAKVAAAAKLLSEAPTDDLELASTVRFLTGRAFSAREERNLQVGWAAFERAALGVLPWDETIWRACARATGDAAEALGKLLEVAPPRARAQRTLAAFAGEDRRGPPLSTCADVARFFEALASAPTAARKVALLEDAFRAVTAPEARVLASLTLGDQRIGFGDPLAEEAIAKAFGRAVADVRLASMLLGDVGEAAILARAGRLADARLTIGHPLQFMLASPIDAPPDDAAAFLVEDKWDGVRTQLHKEGARVRLFSRTLDEVTDRFPEVRDAAKSIPGTFVLDGEVLAWRGDRALPFQDLQRRLGRKEVDAGLRAEIPVRFVAYDLLFHDGREVFRDALEERRARLERLLSGAPPALAVSTARRAASGADVEAMFDAARAAGNEGLVLKRLGTAYDFGKRGKAWLKYKKAYATLDVVVTAAEQGHGKRAGLLSDYTFAVRGPDGALLNVGKAYIGVTDEEIRRLTERLRKLTTEKFGSVHLVKPEVVLEVAFDAVQESARHKSGYALRFPRVVRIRDDKLPAEIDTLERVKELARTGAHSAPGGDADAGDTR